MPSHAEINKNEPKPRTEIAPRPAHLDDLGKVAGDWLQLTAATSGGGKLTLEARSSWHIETT